MKVHNKFLPAVLALAAVLFTAAVPAMAQATGNATFWSTMAVANGGGTLGAAGGPDGVSFYGGVESGDGGSMWANGDLKVNVSTSAASGTLSVMWDQPGTAVLRTAAGRIRLGLSRSILAAGQSCRGSVVRLSR